jgi:hypothetical protein
MSRLSSYFEVSEDSASSAINVRAGCKRVKLPNFLVALPSGSKTIKMYTPFTAKPHPSWKTTVSNLLNKLDLWTTLIIWAQSTRSVFTDVADEYNSTTLGPFSFQIFVLAAWTDKKLQGESKSQAAENHRVLQGRRALDIIGKGSRKRPLSLDISRTSQEMRKSKKARKENLVSREISVDTSHRKLRSRTIVL